MNNFRNFPFDKNLTFLRDSNTHAKTQGGERERKVGTFTECLPDVGQCARYFQIFYLTFSTHINPLK